MALRAFLGALPGDAMSKRSTIVDVGSMTASDCCAFFGEQSGVPKELIHHFALFFVSTPGSVHQFRQDDVIKEHLDRLPPGEFLFSKATHRALEEVPLLKCEATLDLLYLDAEFRVELGAITPTDAQLEKLDDFANPEFLAKKQYVELAQQVVDYPQVKLRESVILPSEGGGATLEAVGLTAGPATVAICFNGVTITPAATNTPRLFAFRQIRRWVKITSRTPLQMNKFGVEFCPSADTFVWIYIKTDEALLAEYTMAAMAPILMKDLHPEWPEPKSAPSKGGGKQENLAWFSEF